MVIPMGRSISVGLVPWNVRTLCATTSGTTVVPDVTQRSALNAKSRLARQTMRFKDAFAPLARTGQRLRFVMILRTDVESRYLKVARRRTGKRLVPALLLPALKSKIQAASLCQEHRPSTAKKYIINMTARQRHLYYHYKKSCLVTSSIALLLFQLLNLRAAWHPPNQQRNHDTRNGSVLKCTTTMKFLKIRTMIRNWSVCQ